MNKCIEKNTEFVTMAIDYYGKLMLCNLKLLSFLHSLEIIIILTIQTIAPTSAQQGRRSTKNVPIYYLFIHQIVVDKRRQLRDRQAQYVVSFSAHSHECRNVS